MRSFSPNSFRGMSFMDVIIGTALMLIIFTALVGLLRSSLKVTSVAKARSVATSIADSQMEYVRSLSYDAVGTVGGIPTGSLPQTATSTQNGLSFTTRTFIQYTDDPADGLASNDTNHITTDYKTIKVSVSYSVSGTPYTITVVSNYAPLGLETTTGGGTLKVVVVNATGVGVSGASVRIQNATTSPAIDLTTFSDSDGIVYLPGAPTSTQYQILVTKNGYSSATTYARDATNQNPTPGYLTVVKDQTTTGTFAIDILASLALGTYSPIATTTFADTFSTATSIASMTNTVVTGGNIQLATDVNGYVPSGSARSVNISPTYLYAWSKASATTSVPTGTTIRFHIADSTGTLLPDTVLSGNAVGFTASVDVSGVSTTTYPTLKLTADLTTTSTSTTPQLQDWQLTYRRGPIPLPNISLTLTGAKAIGTTGGGVAIPKTTLATSTDSNAARTLPLEWDSYALTLPSYDVVDACNAPPYVLSPGTVTNASLVLATSTTNMFLVSVHDDVGAVANATVTLSRTGFSKTVQTSSCGTAYFGGLTSSSGYSISITKTGYTTFSASGITISGHLFYAATLD